MVPSVPHLGQIPAHEFKRSPAKSIPMAERSWRGFAEQRDKYAGVRASRDYRKKTGLLASIGSFIRNMFGK